MGTTEGAVCNSLSHPHALQFIAISANLYNRLSHDSATRVSTKNSLKRLEF